MVFIFNRLQGAKMWVRTDPPWFERRFNILAARQNYPCLGGLELRYPAKSSWHRRFVPGLSRHDVMRQTAACEPKNPKHPIAPVRTLRRKFSDQIGKS
jgi:hypothetical protein